MNDIDFGNSIEIRNNEPLYKHSSFRIGGNAEFALFPSPIFRYFDGCFISEDIGYEKPSVRFFESVIKEIPGYNPEKALIIGDSLTSDMQGGINIGIDTCWYNPNGKALPDGYKLTYIVKDFDEMANMILN